MYLMSEASVGHAHNFVLERPSGRESEGVCSCGERRSFLNYIDDSVWASMESESGRTGFGFRGRRDRRAKEQERRLNNDWGGGW